MWFGSMSGKINVLHSMCSRTRIGPAAEGPESPRAEGVPCLATIVLNRGARHRQSLPNQVPNGIVKATCEALGTLTLIEELGGSMQAMVHVDASAAKSIVERAGLDKVRHIDVHVLWLQEQEIRGRAPLSKIPGTENPADLMTKHLDARKVGEHLTRMKVVFMSGRSEKASNLYVCDEHVQGRNGDKGKGKARRKEENNERGDEETDKGNGRRHRGGRKVR